MRLAMRLIDLTNHPPRGPTLWITLWISFLRLFKKISACRWTNVSGYLYTGNIQRKRQLMLKVTHSRNGVIYVSAVDIRDLAKFEKENTVIMVESFK